MLIRLGAASRFVVLPVLWVVLSGCQGPFLTFPGGALEGPVGHTESFAFAADHRLLQLETRPDDPYSVILAVTVIEGDLYVDAAPARRWHRNLADDSHVRVRLGGTIYPATAVLVDDPAIAERFLGGRSIYRLDPVPGNL